MSGSISNSRNPSKKRVSTASRKRWLQIAAIYLALAIPMTWPVAAQLQRAIPGLIGDAYVHLWNFEWLKNAMLTGQDLFYTPMLFYPVGAELANHNIAWFHFLLWLPLQTLFGGAAAYSLVFILNFSLNGLATHLLVKRITGSQAAAFMGGLIAGFWPYNLSHHGHPNLIAIWWIPLILIALEELFTTKRVRNAIFTGLLVALLGITRWQLLVLGGVLIGLYLVRLLLTTARDQLLRTGALLLLAGGVGAIIMLPLLTPVVRYQLTREDASDLLVSDEVAYGADLASYLLPGRYHPLWGEQIARATGMFAGNGIYVRSIGYTAILLALLATVTQIRRARFWALTAGIHVLLALGPTLYIVGKPYFTLPYRWLEDFLIFQLVRFPDRFNVILCIPVAVLAGLGYRWLQQRPGSPPTHRLLPVAAMLILAESASQYETLPLAVPGWYENLAQETEQHGVLDIPMCPQNDHNKRYMLYQLQHNKPLIQGHVSRPSPSMFAFIDGVPLLRQINCRNEPPGQVENVAEQMRLLAEAGIPFVLLHKEYLSSNQLAAWQAWLTKSPLYEDDLLVVYETKPAAVQSLPFAHAMIDDDRGDTVAGLLSAGIERRSLEQGNWLSIAATWGAAQPLFSEPEICVRLQHSSAKIDVSRCSPLSESWPGSRWQANEIVHANYSIPLDPFLPPGVYSVSLSLRDEATGQDIGNPAQLGQIRVDALARDFSLPSPTITHQATWGDQLLLVGYDSPEFNEQSLRIALYWQAQRRMVTSYKAFLHLIDSRTGQLAAQIDYIPQDWTYPTTWWETGEYVVEHVTLPLAEVATGRYQLWLGWYDPATGARLPVQVTATGQISRGDALLITTLNR